MFWLIMFCIGIGLYYAYRRGLLRPSLEYRLKKTKEAVERLEQQAADAEERAKVANEIRKLEIRRDNAKKRIENAGRR